jgi:hypothetical protein
MFAIRQFIRPRFLIRYQSNTTTDLTNPSPSDIEQKPTADHALWATSETNRLIDYLSARIKAAGPITVADYMREALLNSKYVCYCSSYFLFCVFTFKHLSRGLTRDMKYTEKKVIFSKQSKLDIYMLKYVSLNYSF